MADKQTRLSIDKEELLTFEVKKYPCLFDKANKGYKEKDCVANAWKEIDKELSFTKNGMFLFNVMP